MNIVMKNNVGKENKLDFVMYIILFLNKLIDKKKYFVTLDKFKN